MNTIYDAVKEAIGRTPPTQDIVAALEAIVDSVTIMGTLGALAEMCEGKAEHVQTNWQDADLAKAWMWIGAQLGRIADKTEGM